MFYESARTVGPGWQKPSEEMSWSPSSRRSPGASPESYRRLIRTEEDFPRHRELDEEFFRGRKSPDFPRRLFKEGWDDAPRHRFAERPRLFKRVFKPNHWEEEFDQEDIPRLRRFEREFDRFDNPSRKFDDRHFSAREEFDKSEGKVHHIPIMVERRMEEMKSRFAPKFPDEDWTRPKKTFEPEGGFSKRFDLKSRVASNPIPDTWDPHAVHTLPTRKLHKASQSMDDSKHPPKSVFRSYSETHEDVPKPPQQHSAAFRSHSDGHCPHVTKINVNMPTQKGDQQQTLTQQPEESPADYKTAKFKSKGKYDSPSLQQIAVVLQNVDDLIVRIEGYSGSGRDKQYRFLDEMLTRCMIRLDGIDTEGREDIRNARKAAIREVQACIDRLEAKADESEQAEGPKEAIPLGDGVAIPIGDGSENSPSDALKHAIPLGVGPNMAIPLGDVPRPAIPLEDVPRSSEDDSRPNSGNGEQTKL